MKILIIGNGGREHALTWAISQNPRCTKIYCSPGNAGTAELATNIYIDITSNNKILETCLEYAIDMVVVGPEKQFEQGLTNVLIEKNILVFGPTKEASLLETSKSFTKNMCRHKNIPSGKYEIFSTEADAQIFLRDQNAPYVIKADGLAAGKGVLVSNDIKECFQFISSIFKGKVGTEKNKVIIEEYLEGREMSVFFAIDKNTIKFVGSAQDYKRAFDNDLGPNTGGMGAFSPSLLLTEKNLDKIVNKIVKPTIEYMKEIGTEFSGILYAGLILNNGEPKLIEYNVRFGDPECQVTIPMIKADLVELFTSACEDKLGSVRVDFHTQSAICVVLASEGYPSSPIKGRPVEGIITGFGTPGLNSSWINPAGLSSGENGELIASGGRVLTCTAMMDNLDLARDSAYQKLSELSLEGAHYRTDIGHRAF